MDKEPAKEQLIKLWEWCGFKKFGWTNWDHYAKPGEEPPKGMSVQKAYDGTYSLPKLTLDNLFKYAVPKLDYWLLSNEKTKRPGAVAQYHGKLSGTVFNSDPALALFYAIYELLKESV